MLSKLRKLMKLVAALVAAILLTILGVRIYDSQRGLPLERWHIYVPEELSREELAVAGWKDYLRKEAEIFDKLRHEVFRQIAPDARKPLDRYVAGSPVDPANFVQDFNRSFVLEPQGAPKGVAVLLHGLTDSPYSLRHIAKIYSDRGFVAIVPRLPAHGTVPAALTDVVWEDWQAATRLAVREARRRVDASAPLHLVGYSNGGALAVKYALDSIADETLARPARIVLLSPMIGVTRFARFAGLAGLPAFLPAFAKAAWLDIVPEFNPFKYNSFPVNAARQTHRLTQVLQEQIALYNQDKRLERLPPIITFQSVMDSTVSTPSIVSALYAALPDNGSELVLFDINRAIRFDALVRDRADTLLTRILPEGPQLYRTTILTNDSTGSVVERVTEAGAVQERTRPLNLAYPPGFFSLSHIAVPFPLSDALYGAEPDLSEDFGLNLGTIAPRGERNVLIVSLDTLLRATSNPFFPYMAQRLENGVISPAGMPAGKARP